MMKLKNLIISSKNILYLYVIAFIVSEIIFYLFNQTSPIFSDQYYLEMVADNYTNVYWFIILFSLLILAHHVLPRKDNIPLLSKQVYILMMPYVFIFTFYLNGWFNICFGVIQFHNTFMALFYFGFFMISTLVLILANTLVGRLSMNRSVWGIEYNG